MHHPRKQHPNDLFTSAVSPPHGALVNLGQTGLVARVAKLLAIVLIGGHSYIQSIRPRAIGRSNEAFGPWRFKLDLTH